MAKNKPASEIVGRPGATWLPLGMLALSAGMLAAVLFAGGTGQNGRPPQNPEPTAGKFVRAAAPEPVADLAFLDADGNARRLSEWRGRTVLLNLWAAWCTPCKMEMPSLDRLEAKLGGDDFAVLALSVDRTGPKEPAAFFAREGISRLKLYNDATGDVGRPLRASGLPLSVVLNEKGEEIARFLGPTEWDSPATIAELQALRGK
jgi:thiol-disulfide isomerase/thioredoxin